MIIPMRAGNRIGASDGFTVIITKTDHGKFARLKPKAWRAVSLKGKQLVGSMRNRSHLYLIGGVVPAFGT